MPRPLVGWKLSIAILEVLCLAIWIGALTIILVAVIPAVFNTLGMETGGRFLRRVFDSYNMVTSGIVIVLVLTTVVRARSVAASGVLQEVGRVEIVLLAALALVTTLIVMVFGPRAIELQEGAFAADGELAKKVAYDAFFRTHMIVRALHLVNAALAVSLLVVKIRGWVQPTRM